MLPEGCGSFDGHPSEGVFQGFGKREEVIFEFVLVRPQRLFLEDGYEFGDERSDVLDVVDASVVLIRGDVVRVLV